MVYDHQKLKLEPIVFNYTNSIKFYFYPGLFCKNNKSSLSRIWVIVLNIFTEFAVFTFIIVIIVIVFCSRQRLFQQHFQFKSGFINSPLCIMIDYLLLFFISALLYCILVLIEIMKVKMKIRIKIKIKMKMKIKWDERQLAKAEEGGNRTSQ